MKKKILAIGLVVVILCVAMTACNSSNNSKLNEFNVNKIVYDGDYITLTCKKITSHGMDFDVKNKSTDNISVMLDVSLDEIDSRLCMEQYSLWKIGANETKECRLNGTLEYPEHKIMSLYGIVFVNNAGAETFDICDFNLGGKRNLETEYTDGEVQYQNENLVVEYMDVDAQGVNFKVENKRDKSISIGFESFTINNGSEDYALSVRTIPSHTTAIYKVDILTYNENYFPDDLQSFEGVMATRIDGRGKVDRFPIAYTVTTK